MGRKSLFKKTPDEINKVKLEKPGTFQFIKLDNNGREFYCLGQSLPVLVWVLFLKKDLLQPIVRQEKKIPLPRKMLSFLWKPIRLTRVYSPYLIQFLRYKFKQEKHAAAVHLPIYGHLCVPVHKGFKIFNIRKNVVAKVFDHDVDSTSIGKEIHGLKKVSLFDFAPSLKRWNVEERWYEEEFLNGVLDASYIPLDSVSLLQKFSQELVHPLNKLILFEPPITRKSLEYLDEIVGIVKNSRLAKDDATLNEFHIIKTFIESIVERLRSEGTCSVFLVFTHGDFCPANMLTTRQGMKIIDWEGAGSRSVLFDVYSYFFYRPVSRKVPVPTLASELKEAIPFFVANLDGKAPAISHSLRQQGNIYRWIYYVEQICKEVEREATDKNLNILQDILGYIETFSRYEELLVLQDQGVTCVG